MSVTIPEQIQSSKHPKPYPQSHLNILIQTSRQKEKHPDKSAETRIRDIFVTNDEPVTNTLWRLQVATYQPWATLTLHFAFSPSFMPNRCVLYSTNEDTMPATHVFMGTLRSMPKVARKSPSGNKKTCTQLTSRDRLLRTLQELQMSAYMLASHVIIWHGTPCQFEVNLGILLEYGKEGQPSSCHSLRIAFVMMQKWLLTEQMLNNCHNPILGVFQILIRGSSESIFYKLKTSKQQRAL